MKIRIPYMLQQYTRGIETADIKGKTVGECLNILVKEFPDIKSRIFDESGQLLKHFNLYLNNRNVSGLASPVKDDDELLILVAIDGG